MGNVIGLCLVGLSALALQGCGKAEAQQASAPANQRYVIVHSPHLQRDTQMLDTATGRTWLLVEDADKNLVWEERERLNLPAR